MFKTFSKIALIVTISTNVFSCLKVEDYPIEPIITFNSFTLNDTIDDLGNNIHLYSFIIDFTDGDGDIGLQEEDTIAPFDIHSPYYYNLWVTPFSKKGNFYQEIETTIPLHARIPYLTPTGQNQNLKGEIEYDINISDIVSDTIILKIQLIDRELHESNIIESPNIITLH